MYALKTEEIRENCAAMRAYEAQTGQVFTS